MTASTQFMDWHILTIAAFFFTHFVRRWSNLPPLTVWKCTSIWRVFSWHRGNHVFKARNHITLGPKTPPIYIYIHILLGTITYPPWKVSFWVDGFPNFPTQVGRVFSFPGGNHRPMVLPSGHTDPVCPRYEMPSSYQPDPPKGCGGFLVMGRMENGNGSVKVAFYHFIIILSCIDAWVFLEHHYFCEFFVVQWWTARSQ